MRHPSERFHVSQEWNRGIRLIALGLALVLIVAPAASAQTLLASGLEGPVGSAIGPDGALYVTEAAAGKISRIDPWTGHITTFAEGLPERVIPVPGLGGAMDVAFLDGVAYALVTLVDSGVGGSDIDGIYRVDGPDDFTVIADIGAFSVANPPNTSFENPTGLQYAMETFRGGFLVTDGHHNRVLQVSLDGGISQLITLGNVAPTGLEVHGDAVYVAQLGPAPNNPEDGKVTAFDVTNLTVSEVGSGARMLVDVEFGLGRTLYALGHGVWDGVFPGSSAIPNTGTLVEINPDGTLTEVATGLNQPTSMEFIGNSAYIVSLSGEIWVIEGVSSPPFGRRR